MGAVRYCLCTRTEYLGILEVKTMKKTTIKFEIHNVTEQELLCDDVCFDDIPELLYAYEYMYPDDQIVACYRETTVTERVRLLPKEEFAHDWYCMLDEIIDNLEH